MGFFRQEYWSRFPFPPPRTIPDPGSNLNPQLLCPLHYRQILYCNSLQYTWASLVALLVENLPAIQETWVWSLGWEDSPGEGKGHPLQYSGLENSMDCIVHKVTKNQTRLSTRMASQWQLQLEPGTPPLAAESWHPEMMRLQGHIILTASRKSSLTYLIQRLPGLCLYTCHDRELTTYLRRQPAHGWHSYC